MDEQTHGSVMNQKIFDLKLSVVAVSLYLLCCSLVDRGITISNTHIHEIWNGSEDDLRQALTDLEQCNIMSRILSDQDQRHIYHLVPAHEWRPS